MNLESVDKDINNPLANDNELQAKFDAASTEDTGLSESLYQQEQQDIVER